MQRSTRQRDAILAVLRHTGRPLGPEEIHRAARLRVPRLALATVYRNLRRLAEADAVAAVQLPGDAPRYELREAAERHHHHFRCDRCDAVYDLNGCPGGFRQLVPEGFSLRRHDVVLYGLCSACGEQET